MGDQKKEKKGKKLAMNYKLGEGKGKKSEEKGKKREGKEKRRERKEK